MVPHESIVYSTIDGCAYGDTCGTIFHAIHGTSHGDMVYKARHSSCFVKKKLLSITKRSLVLLSITYSKLAEYNPSTCFILTLNYSVKANIAFS